VQELAPLMHLKQTTSRVFGRIGAVGLGSAIHNGAASFSHRDCLHAGHASARMVQMLTRLCHVEAQAQTLSSRGSLRGRARSRGFNFFSSFPDSEVLFWLGLSALLDSQQMPMHTKKNTKS
jgi:hypothetical protein